MHQKPDLLKKRHFTGQHIKRIKYSKLKNNTATRSTISSVFTIIGYSVDPSSNDGKVCKTNVRVESSTTDNDRNPNI